MLLLDMQLYSLDNYLKNEYQDYANTKYGVKILELFTLAYINKKKSFDSSYDEVFIAFPQLKEALAVEEYALFLYRCASACGDCKYKLCDLLIAFMPNDTTPSFTYTINRFWHVTRNEPDVERWFLNKLDVAIDSENELLTMKVFYTLFTYYHRLSDYDINKRLVYQTRSILEKKHPLWKYAYSQVLSKASGKKDKSVMMHALSECQSCIDIYMDPENDFAPNYPGIYHAYAELVLETLEYGFFETDQEERETFIKRGLSCVDKAIEINASYAKYYYTKGKLICFDKNDDERYIKAKELINHALNIEDSKRPDYEFIRAKYMLAKVKCENEETNFKSQQEISTQLSVMIENSEKQKLLMDETINKLQQEINTQLEVMRENTAKQEKAMNNATETLNEEIDKARDAINDEKQSVLEKLGFFTGIISIILVASHTVFNLNAIESIIVLIAFAGILLLSFTVLRLVVLDESNNKTQPNHRQQLISILLIFLSVIIIAISVTLLIFGKNNGWI